MNKKITVVIVTFNSSHLVEDMLDQLNSFDVVIFDNDSDDSQALNKMSLRHNNVTLILHKENIGYGRAANLAIQQCGTPYVFLANPDISLSDAALDKLLGITNKLSTNWLCIAPNTDIHLNTTETEEYSETSWASGSALLINKENFNRLNGFDTNIFLFFEETDLFYRAKQAGQKIYRTNHVHVPHAVGQSVQHNEKLEFFKEKHFHWSKLYFHKKHRHWLTLASLLFKSLCVYPLKTRSASNPSTDKKRKKISVYMARKEAAQLFIKGLQPSNRYA